MIQNRVFVSPAYRFHRPRSCRWVGEECVITVSVQFCQVLLLHPTLKIHKNQTQPSGCLHHLLPWLLHRADNRSMVIAIRLWTSGENCGWSVSLALPSFRLGQVAGPSRDGWGRDLGTVGDRCAFCVYSHPLRVAPGPPVWPQILFVCFSVALRLQKPSGLLGTGSPGRPPHKAPELRARGLYCSVSCWIVHWSHLPSQPRQGLKCS